MQVAIHQEFHPGGMSMSERMLTSRVEPGSSSAASGTLFSIPASRFPIPGR
jgi:hypothetical protein